MSASLSAEPSPSRNRRRTLTFAAPSWILVLATAFLILSPSAFAVEPATAKNVLLLYSFSDRSVFSPPEVLEAAVRARVPGTVTFYIEYLEGRRFEANPSYERDIVEHLQHAYGREKIDLVIVAAYPALQLAVRHREELFPGAPIFFMEVAGSRIAGQKIWPGVTGVTMKLDLRGTIDLALHLHPETNTIAAITEDSPFERYWLGRIQAELVGRKGLREVDFVGLPAGELLKRVAALPRHTIVLFDETPQEAVNPTTGPHELLAVIGQRFPTYCIFPVECLDHGGIGGVDYDLDEENAIAAQMVGRLLSGEPPENIPVRNLNTDYVRVDWRQLRYWHIPESALPPGSQVLYREPSVWQRDRNYIIAAILLIVVQALSIAGLMLQRSRKRKAEAVLRESEQRFRVMADTTPSLVWMCDREGKITYLNERRVEFTGSNLDPKAGYGVTWTAYVHPDDIRRVLAMLARALKSREAFSNEYRLRRSDGVYRWMFDVATPRTNGDGSFGGFIGSAIDITDQKIAQEALENVSGKLIEAQEKERSRIARDLHDDICQRLALLSMELEQANRKEAPPSTKKRLEEIRQHCAEIAGDVQALSHELHSSKLDYLGIVAAIKGFCKEFAKQHDVTVEFTDENMPTRLPKDVSLCLFRITQESLHNAVKYSGTNRFSVALRSMGNEAQLVVADAGAGFNVDEAKKNGLGLISMQERVHLVRGELHIESQPGAGTRIVATVPVIAAVESAPDADQAMSVTGAA